MAKSYNTDGVPEPEVSARSMRDATRALPDDTNVSPPRCYSQCVEAPGKAKDQVLPGNGPAYYGD